MRPPMRTEQEEERIQHLREEAERRYKEEKQKEHELSRMARQVCKNGYLLDLDTPPWATSMVRNFRHDAKIPAEINDVTLFVAIESNRITVFNPEDQVDALRHCLGLKQVRKRT
jgi:hypothetical protein